MWWERDECGGRGMSGGGGMQLWGKEVAMGGRDVAMGERDADMGGGIWLWGEGGGYGGGM